MRLQNVHISDYKNLKDFTLSFDNDSFLDVFVGKNGTGKPNLFEALIEIFRNLLHELMTAKPHVLGVELNPSQLSLG